MRTQPGARDREQDPRWPGHRPAAPAFGRTPTGPEPDERRAVRSSAIRGRASQRPGLSLKGAGVALPPAAREHSRRWARYKLQPTKRRLARSRGCSMMTSGQRASSSQARVARSVVHRRADRLERSARQAGITGPGPGCRQWQGRSVLARDRARTGARSGGASSGGGAPSRQRTGAPITRFLWPRGALR